MSKRLIARALREANAGQLIAVRELLKAVLKNSPVGLDAGEEAEAKEALRCFDEEEYDHPTLLEVLGKDGFLDKFKHGSWCYLQAELIKIFSVQKG